MSELIVGDVGVVVGPGGAPASLSRARVRFVVRDSAGNVIENAAVFVYEQGTTIPVILWEQSAGGVEKSNPLITNNQGEIEAWLDNAQVVDLLITDNSNTAFLPIAPSSQLDWPSFTENVDVHGSPLNPLIGTPGDGTVTNAKVAENAGILKSKLDALEIVDADVAAGAAIQLSKLEIDVDGDDASPSLRSLGYEEGKAAPGVFTITESFPLVVSDPGTAIKTGQHRVYAPGGFAWNIGEVRAALGSAPTGAAYRVDVNVNGSSIYAANADKPTIAIGANTALGGTKVTDVIGAGEYFTFDIEQVGSTATGEFLTISVFLTRQAHADGFVEPEP